MTGDIRAEQAKVQLRLERAQASVDHLGRVLDCNCPSTDDVIRHGVGTKPPCPVHDTPEVLALLARLADVIVPAISGPYEFAPPMDAPGPRAFCLTPQPNDWGDIDAVDLATLRDALRSFAPVSDHGGRLIREISQELQRRSGPA